MDWLALVSGLVKLVSGITKFLYDKQLLDAGEGRAALRGLNETLVRIRKAEEARAVESDEDDEYMRD